MIAVEGAPVSGAEVGMEVFEFTPKDGSEIIERNGVGLGFTYDTLFQMQADMVNGAGNGSSRSITIR